MSGKTLTNQKWLFDVSDWLTDTIAFTNAALSIQGANQVNNECGSVIFNSQV